MLSSWQTAQASSWKGSRWLLLDREGRALSIWALHWCGRFIFMLNLILHIVSGGGPLLPDWSLLNQMKLVSQSRYLRALHAFNDWCEEQVYLYIVFEFDDLRMSIDMIRVLQNRILRVW